MGAAAYVGRFAPSPTGPLHLGSLIAAVASWLDARAHGGRWLLRIEDIDTPRTRPGAAAVILRTLQAHALTWDGPVTWQSERLAHYQAALDRLVAQRQVFYCTCSRSRLRSDPIYPGHCRQVTSPPAAPYAVRLRVPAAAAAFTDVIQGHYSQPLDRDVGDFVIHRRDGLFAYQLVVAVDDALQHVTRVVRGADLLDSTPRQLLILDLLGYRRPDYAHVPVVVDRSGAKLSKQTRATAIDDRFAGFNLHMALTLLGQSPPAAMSRRPPEALLHWGVRHWDASQVPRRLAFDGFVSL